MRYVNLSELELNKDYIFCWVDCDNYYNPINAIVKKDGSKRCLVDPDDDFYIYHLLEFVKDMENKLLVFDSLKEANNWCWNSNKIDWLTL